MTPSFEPSNDRTPGAASTSVLVKSRRKPHKMNHLASLQKKLKQSGHCNATAATLEAPCRMWRNHSSSAAGPRYQFPPFWWYIYNNNLNVIAFRNRSGGHIVRQNHEIHSNRNWNNASARDKKQRKWKHSGIQQWLWHHCSRACMSNKKCSINRWKLNSQEPRLAYSNVSWADARQYMSSWESRQGYTQAESSLQYWTT